MLRPPETLLLGVAALLVSAGLLAAAVPAGTARTPVPAAAADTPCPFGDKLVLVPDTPRIGVT